MIYKILYNYIKMNGTKANILVYIDYKGKAEVILTLRTKEKDLFNICKNTITSI